MIYILYFNTVIATIVAVAPTGAVFITPVRSHIIDHRSVVYLILLQIRFYDQQYSLLVVVNSNNGTNDQSSYYRNSIHFSSAAMTIYGNNGDVYQVVMTVCHMTNDTIVSVSVATKATFPVGMMQSYDQYNLYFDTKINTAFDTAFDTAFNTAFNTVFDIAFDTAFDTSFDTAFDTVFVTMFATVFATVFVTACATAFDTALDTVFDTAVTAVPVITKISFVNYEEDSLADSLSSTIYDADSPIAVTMKTYDMPSAIRDGFISAVNDEGSSAFTIVTTVIITMTKVFHELPSVIHDEMLFAVKDGISFANND